MGIAILPKTDVRCHGPKKEPGSDLENLIFDFEKLNFQDLTPQGTVRGSHFPVPEF
jgi:hypothetical protein